MLRAMLRPGAGRGGLLLGAGPLGVLVLGAALLAGCSSAAQDEGLNGKTVLAMKQGDTSIQVTEARVSGNQVVRINTRYKGEDHTIYLQIDQPVYDVEIPLTIEQIAPQTAA
ncbi:MAG TPA: hypothetical protein VL359_20550, partial [bacterium]|nr:hypothetical protein [bacterium]